MVNHLYAICIYKKQTETTMLVPMYERKKDPRLTFYLNSN